jgi:hypothetical protein
MYYYALKYCAHQKKSKLPVPKIFSYSNKPLVTQKSGKLFKEAN